MNLEFNIATSWNELNEYQRAKISELIFLSEKGSKWIYFLTMYYLFCDSPFRFFKIQTYKDRLNFFRLLRQVPFSDLLSYIEFVFVELSLTKFPKFVKIDGVKYYGPADRLSNVSIEELNFAYKFYFEWMTTQDVSALDRLITVIYRPGRKKKRGDIRELFDVESITSRGNVFPKLGYAQKISIGFAFKGSVEQMFSKFPVLFPPSKSTPEGAQQFKKPKYQSLVPMINAMFMYENQPLGPRKDVIKTNANVFFDVAQETVIAAKKREAELKKHK